MKKILTILFLPGYLLAQSIVPILPDFQVNENIGFCDQLNQDLALDAAGNLVVVWQDARNGNWDIFGQRYNSSGGTIGINFKITDDPDNRNHHYNPAVATAADGHFIVVWQHAEHEAIYGQIYDAAGQAVGGNFRVDDDTQRQGQVIYPDIAVNSSGAFVVVWEDYHHGNQHDVNMQRFLSSGQKIGLPIKVNDSAIGRYPAVSLNDAGDCIVVWQDERNDEGDIYGQRFNAVGNPLGNNFKIDDQIQYKAMVPAVGMNEAGGFVVIWQDYRDGSELIHIYGQRFNELGEALGANFRVGSGNRDARNCDLSVGDAGNFCVVVQDNRDDNYNIYFQQYDANGQAVGAYTLVNDDGQLEGQYNPHVIMNDDQIAITWEDRRRGNYDIFGQRYTGAGAAIAQNFQVNDDQPGSGWNQLSDIAGSPTGDIWIVWDDLHRQDIYCQRYQKLTTPVMPNFRVNDDPIISVRQTETCIGLDGAGNAVVVWRDYRNPVAIADIYGQRFDREGKRLGANFRVNDDAIDDPESYGQYGPALAVRQDGSFVICWHDQRHRHSGRAWVIYGQRYDAQGAPLGSNFQISDDSRVSSKLWSKIDMDSSGNFVVVWQDTMQGSWDIFGQLFTADGQRRGNNFQINLPQPKSQCHWPDVCFGAGGEFMVVWIEEQGSPNAAIYQRLFRPDGTPHGDPAKINDNTTPSSISLGRCSWSKLYRNFIVAWQDNRNGDFDIYAQLLDAQGIPIGANYRVNDDTGTNYQIGVRVALADRLLYYTWEDTRIPGHGRDIFARVDQLNYAPETPLLLLPVDGAIIRSDSPTLGFSTPNDADGDSLHFRIDIATDSSFVNPISGSPFESRRNTAGFSPVPPVAAGQDSCHYTLQLPLADGVYFWRVAAFDGWEFSAPAESRTIIIDHTPPQNLSITLMNPQYLDYWYNQDSTPMMLVQVRYDELHPAAIELQVPDVDTVVYDTALPGGLNQTVQLPFGIQTASDGLYILTVKLSDQSGYSDSTAIVFYLDHTPPTGTIATAVDTSHTCSFMVRRSGTPTDGYGSGVAPGWDVRVKVDDGAWQTWLSYFVGDSARFTGEHGRTYFFEAAGYDFLGNREIFTGIPETFTVVDTIVLPPESGFEMIAEPQQRSITAGDSTFYTIRLNPINSFADTVTLATLNPDPSALLLKMEPARITPQQTARLSVKSLPTKNEPQSYPILISGRSGTITVQDIVWLEVMPRKQPDFSIELEPDSLTLVAGTDGIVQISIMPENNFNEPVQLRMRDSLQYFDVEFSTNPLPPGEIDTLRLHCDRTTPAGVYELHISGTVGELMREQTLTLTILPAPDFKLIVTPAIQTAKAGFTVTYRVQMEPLNGFNESIVLYLDKLPEKVTGSCAPARLALRDTSKLTIVTEPAAASGTYIFEVIGKTAYDLAHRAEVTLQIEGRVIGASPNPFTPNGDGFNDLVLFKYDELNNSNSNIHIFNFRGKKVKEIQGDVRWDGTDDQNEALPPGVYIFVVKANNKIIDKGPITLIR
jgi:gliding motility-associated-like protein